MGYGLRTDLEIETMPPLVLTLAALVLAIMFGLLDFLILTG